ncbi:hypothetical protein ACP70R_003782 [Stipagrostis hirtigluma subsp. patula]
MPPAELDQEGKGGAPVAGGDGIDALPDGVLEHILGFLPAEEAVRTCVLARRWRHRWKFAMGLHVVAADGEFLGSVNKLREFMDHLLRARGGSALDTCDLTFGGFNCSIWPRDAFEFHDDVQRLVSLWFRHALMYRPRVLRLRIHADGTRTGAPWLELDSQPLVSQHLTRLELAGVLVQSSFLDLSACPALEHLVLECCALWDLDKISSKSLKYLSITETSFSYESRVRIDAPNLVSLHLDETWGEGRIPLLESMPSLVQAFVRITDGGDYCKLWYANYWDCDCKTCDDSNNCVLLKGLTEARSLTLFSKPDKFIFKRDLRFCPTFSKLRTLLLNDYWCVPNDFCELACILECSPILENLTLELSSKSPEHMVEMKGSVRPMKGSAAISEHLKIVKIKCQMVDERVQKLALFLCAFNIRYSHGEVEVLE